MPATKGSRISRNSTTAARTAASMVIQNMMGRAVAFIDRQCETPAVTSQSGFQD